MSAFRGFTGATYHLDDIDISLSGNNYSIDTNHLPPKEDADRLVNRYFDTVHPLIPIISKAEFESMYQSLYFSGPSAVGNYWLMVINLVFACGSRSAESVGVRTSCAHLDFFNSARVLGALDGGTLFAIAELKDVQALGLMVIYLLGSMQINRLVQSFRGVAEVAVVAVPCGLDCGVRSLTDAVVSSAWNAVGLANQLAVSLGLHLRLLDSKLEQHESQMRVRVWYSIEYLETTLSLVTGRPITLLDPDRASQICPSTAISRSAPESYYSAMIQLSQIVAVVQDEIYSSTTTGTGKHKGKQEMRSAIRVLRRRLDRWKRELPPTLDFTAYHHDSGLDTQVGSFQISPHAYQSFPINNRPPRREPS